VGSVFWPVRFLLRSRNLMGPKTHPTIWGTYMKLVTKYQISAFNSCWEKCDEKWAMHIFRRIFLSNYWWQESDIWSQASCRYAILWETFLDPSDKQEVGIWWVQKRFPQYGVPIWSLWPNIRSLSSIVAEKNVTKNVHICSMCILLLWYVW
jgi:hypothetical protein